MSTDAAAGHSPEDLAALVPGTWRIRATNSPLWLTGERTSPTYSYTIVSSDPLRLTVDARWLAADGSEKHLPGTVRWKNGVFVWRGRWLRSFLRSRWAITGSSDDGNIVVIIRFDKSAVTPRGIDVIVREGVKVDDPRARVARSAARFGLTPEDFASLAWLPADTH